MIYNDISVLNNQFKDATPQHIIKSIVDVAQRPIITTNFGPFSASLLHAVTRLKNDIPVIWGDSGYSTEATYAYAQVLESQLGLALNIYTPRLTRGYLDSKFGDVTQEVIANNEFTEIVKLEPLVRAFDDYNPDVWFTNIRKGQTAYRDNLGIFSRSKSGVLKVSPFYKFTDEALASYLEKHQLPNEFSYYDPTKITKNSECGLHISSL